MRGISFLTRLGFLAFFLCSLLPGAAADVVHTVKKGDNLEHIAKKYKTSKAAIIQRNNLKKADFIMVGQKLVIPGSGATSPALNPELKKLLDQVKVPGSKWKYIVIHHSASIQGSPKGMDRYHREERNMENGLAYHFVIGNGKGMPDGHVHVGHRWSRQIEGGHLASENLNRVAIGICLVGNFNEGPPSQAQMKSLTVLTNYLMERCHLSKTAIKTHTRINTRPTVCPGKHFSEKAFLATLQMPKF